MTNLGYLLEAAIPIHRQNMMYQATKWLEDNSPNKGTLTDRISNVLQGFTTLYMEEDSRAETQLHFSGGKIKKGTSNTDLTTSIHGDAIVMLEGEFFSSKKRG